MMRRLFRRLHIVVCLSFVYTFCIATDSAFLSRVCDTSNVYYDSCSCDLASWNLNHSQGIACFNQFSCPFDASVDAFCSGRGVCNFANSTCLCDEGFGSSDCSRRYQEFAPSLAVTVPLMLVSGILFFVSVALIFWVHVYRDVDEVKAMSVVFTHLTNCGCALICIGSIFVALGYDQTNCVMLEWFQFLGINIVIACALLKSYRIAAIFKSDSNISPSDLTDSQLLKYFAIILTVDVFFLTLYTIFNFLDGGAYQRNLEAELLTETRCSSSPLTMISYSLLVGWQLLLLLFVLKYGNDTKSAYKHFKETKCIYVGSNIGSICFIAFGIFVLFTTNLTLQIVTRGFGSLFVVSMALSLLFWPKFKAVYVKQQQVEEQEEVYEDDQGNKFSGKEMEKKRKFQTYVKEPNGKELLFLLDALVQELTYRMEHKMLSIDMIMMDSANVLKLANDVKSLIPADKLDAIEEAATMNHDHDDVTEVSAADAKHGRNLTITDHAIVNSLNTDYGRGTSVSPDAAITTAMTDDTGAGFQGPVKKLEDVATGSNHSNDHSP